MPSFRCLVPLALAGALVAADPPPRALTIAVAADAPSAVRNAAQRVRDAVTTHPLLSRMAAGQAALSADSATLASGPSAARAYTHLIVVGLPTDPLVWRTAQHEARVRSDGAWEIYGTGILRGSIGYLEADRNPFLHSMDLASTPYEAEAVVLTGSDAAGVGLAVDAFLQRGLVNGVVAGAGWRRPEPTLLDGDPLPSAEAPPSWLPTAQGTTVRIGLSHLTEEVYRGIAQTAQARPRRVWLAKFLVPGAWDHAGSDWMIYTYMAGLDNRAYASALQLMRFADAAAADAAAARIATAAGLTASGGAWSGAQPEYSWGDAPSEPSTLWRKDEWLVMSTLDATTTAALRSAIAAAPSDTTTPPANVAPVARIAALPSSLDAGHPVRLDGSASSDADGGITAYAWLVDSQALGAGAMLDTLLPAGTHTLRLRVTDDRGATGETTLPITVAPAQSVTAVATADSVIIAGSVAAGTVALQVDDRTIPFAADGSYRATVPCPGASAQVVIRTRATDGTVHTSTLSVARPPRSNQ